MKKNGFIPCISIVISCALFITVSAYAQPAAIHNSAELQIALRKLQNLGSVLYFAAHPDDENTAVLACLSKGKKYRTAYLSLTRGDGGQNLIGPEKGAEIGIIRTQELLSARAVDGADQFFTRAIDFGYSKTPEETLEIWDKKSVLFDVVRVIRQFRPDVIISRFTPDSSGGHGHHTASALLIKEAFAAAADPTAFPEQLQYVQPWQAVRLFWNSWRPGQQEQDKLLRIDVGAYDPFLGKSYTELAAESRSMHKTQGFGSSGRRGARYDYFKFIEGVPAENDMFEGIDTTWNRVPGGQKIGTMLDDIINNFNPGNPSESIPKLLDVYGELNTLEDDHWISIKRKEVLQVIRMCAGLWMEAISEDYAASPGEEIQIITTLVNRSDQQFTVDEIQYPEAAIDSSVSLPLMNNEPLTIEKTLRISDDFMISQPYWLKAQPTQGLFSVSDQTLTGLPENPSTLNVTVTLGTGGNHFEYSLPVVFRWTDRVDGELYRPFEVRPPVTVNFENKVCIFADDRSKKVNVKVTNHSYSSTGELRLSAPESWTIKPAKIPFSLTAKHEEQLFTFTVFPPQHSDKAELAAEAVINGTTYDKALVDISYPHIERQVYFPQSTLQAIKLDINNNPDSRIGYIMGSGDEIPDGLRNLGYDVVIMNDEMLENNDLSHFDTVITGIRAYNTRDRLQHITQKLMQFVKNGGTLIVQYNVANGLVTQEIGPYPFTIGQDRVTVESAPVTFTNPDHQLLHYPNKITQKDFDGWVQERGLYFATQWDDNYEVIVSSHDPGEEDKHGGLLFARYGKGIFIYTGYSWFRQIPAGIPGAYRLFVNMISAGKYNGK